MLKNVFLLIGKNQQISYLILIMNLHHLMMVDFQN